MPISLNRIRRLPELTQAAVVAAAICVPLILLTLTLLVGRGFDETAVLRQEVIRSYEARADLERIFSLHQDMETSQRGFVITRDQSFLKPYFIASGQVDAAFSKLEGHLSGKATYRAELAKLRDLSVKKRRFVARSIALARSGDEAAARSLVAGGEGKRLMDEIRALVEQMETAERTQLGYATAVADTARATLRYEIFALQALLLLLLALAAFFIARSKASGDRARRRSDDLAARQAAIFDSAKDGMIVLNGSGSIESLNPAAAQMFGRAPEDLVRRDIGVLAEVAPDRGQVESFLRRLEANRGGTAGEFREFIGRRSDNSSFPLEVSLSPVQLADTTKFLAVFRDISERREIEQIKGEFVATVSHELRTPLTSIAGSLGLITGGAAGPIPSRAFRLIQIAHSNSARLVRLVNDILDIEKIEAGRMTFDIKPISLDHLLRRAVRDNAGFATEYGVRVELAPGPPNAAVLADEDRLAQVVTNLLSNAVKFSPRDGVVRVSASALDRRYRISVSDEGEGIPEAFRERIFSKFAQADNSDSRQKGGTGLGLSIVREIVTRIGGNISFESRVGQGATFHVDLPAADAIPVPQIPASALRDRGALPCILHVDDDPDMLRVLSGVFEGRADILPVRSVEEAKAAIRQTRFGAAILDIGLVDGNGLELVPLLRQSDPAMPIVVFTAQEADPVEMEGVDLVLVKSRATLDRLVAAVMDRINQREVQAK